MCEILEIRIPNLGNSDAIIIALQKEEATLVILIDAGKPHHIHTITAELSNVLNKYNKQGPDLVICTHYDFDHIGGIEEIVSRYRIHIKEVWMHKTSRLINIANKLEATDDSTGLILPDEEAQNLSIDSNGIIDYDDDHIQNVLQQLKHEIDTLKALEDMGVTIKEPVFEHCSLENWPEIEVLGPTMSYYEDLFPEHFDWKDFLDTGKIELTTNLSHPAQENEHDFFVKLDSIQRSKLTPTNLNSAIIQIETNEGKFLFAADAGISSFQNISNYEERIRNVHFLKVPHHGSSNNLDSRIIQLMNPRVAYISGGSHISSEVVGALRQQGATVFSTHEQKQTLIYPTMQ